MTNPLPIEPTENNSNEEDPKLQPYERFRKERGGYRSHHTFQKFLAFIESRGEATPGELAKEFGWARSSLSYSLNRLAKEGKIVRIGGGRSIRYRITTREEKDAHWEAKCAEYRQKNSIQAVSTPTPVEEPSEPAPVEKPKESGLLPAGLRNLFRKFSKE